VLRPDDERLSLPPRHPLLHSDVFVFASRAAPDRLLSSIRFFALLQSEPCAAFASSSSRAKLKGCLLFTAFCSGRFFSFGFSPLLKSLAPSLPYSVVGDAGGFWRVRFLLVFD